MLTVVWLLRKSSSLTVEVVSTATKGKFRSRGLILDRTHHALRCPLSSRLGSKTAINSFNLEVRVQGK